MLGFLHRLRLAVFPLDMVGQRSAQCGWIDVGQPCDQIGEDTKLDRSKVIVVFRKRQWKPLLQECMESLDGAVVGFAHDSL